MRNGVGVARVRRRRSGMLPLAWVVLSVVGSMQHIRGETGAEVVAIV